MVGRKENRSYLTGILYIKENAFTITRSKIPGIKRIHHLGELSSAGGGEENEARMAGGRLCYEKCSSDY